MATVTITAILETDNQVDLTCSFVNTTPAISWIETIALDRRRLDGMTQAQIRDEVFFPVCQAIISGRIGVRRAQTAATSILNIAQTVPNTN